MTRINSNVTKRTRKLREDDSLHMKAMESVMKAAEPVMNRIDPNIINRILKLCEDNAHHIKAKDILVNALETAMKHPDMTAELKETASLFILLLEETGDTFKYDADSVMAPVVEIVEKDTRSKSGKYAADARHKKTRDLGKAIKGIWATGKYSDRNTCAEQEWEALGFGSYDTARDKLTNTPDPSPWPAKHRKKK